MIKYKKNIKYIKKKIYFNFNICIKFVKKKKIVFNFCNFFYLWFYKKSAISVVLYNSTYTKKMLC